MAKFQLLISCDLAAQKKITIGRDLSCDIVLPDPTVSGLHAMMIHRDGQTVIQDCNSKNGVFVNRKKITQEAVLHRGDIITLGDSMLIPEDLAAAVSCEQPEKSAPLATKRLGAKSGVRELETLLFMAQRLQQDLNDLDGLLRNILSVAANTLQCESGYIEYDAAGEKKVFVFRRGQISAKPVKIEIDQNLLEQVRLKGLPMVIENNQEAGAGELPEDQPHGPLLCAGFLDRQKRVNGVICLYDRLERERFQDKDLLFLQQLTGLAGLILQNSNLIREMEDEKRRAEKNLAMLERQQSIGQFFIGKTKSMVELKVKIDRLAAVHSNVLITGETGVGKGMVARLIHQLSARAKKPFVSQNCAGIPEDLIESTLFGHMKGAFTHAVADQEGLFELAHGGTLFLDEIGDLSFKSQAKILAVIEDRMLRRLGGKKDIPVDIRLICASHKNLQQMAEEGSFRKDLLYRLQVAVLHIPALRMRKQDIPYLVDCFLQQFSREIALTPTQVAPEALAVLREYDWPGNLRQLRNVIESAIIWGDGRILRLADLPEAIKGTAAKPLTWEETERQYLLQVLQSCRNNISAAARCMGMDRTTVYEKLKKYGLQK